MWLEWRENHDGDCIFCCNRQHVNVMPCCQSAVVVDPVRRNKYVLGRYSGRKLFVQFTNFLMLPMEVLNLVSEGKSFTQI